MITVNYICDRCGTYTDAGDLFRVEINSIDSDYTRFDRVYDICQSCTDKLIEFIEKEEHDDPTNN